MRGQAAQAVGRGHREQSVEVTGGKRQMKTKILIMATAIAIVALAGCQSSNKLDVITTTTTAKDGSVITVTKDRSNYTDYGMYSHSVSASSDAKAEVVKGLAAGTTNANPAVANGAVVGLVAIGAAGAGSNANQSVAPPQKDSLVHEVADTARWAFSEKFANDRASKAADVALHQSDNALKAQEDNNTLLSGLAANSGGNTAITNNLSGTGNGLAVNDGSGSASGMDQSQNPPTTTSTSTSNTTNNSTNCYPILVASGVAGGCP